MLSKVRIENFQSLKEVELELQPLTVIVGPSSSGKSALTRALKTLTSNARGESFISHGERTCTITAHTDKGIVSLSRGGTNQYTIIPEHNDAEKKVFTKLNGNTPDDVSAFIGIPAKDPLNYSNQFDMPYLLTSSAGEVARTLGELTNVHVIFEAAREANRQRLTHTGTLKTRAGDYAELTKNLESYAQLSEQQAAITEAAEAHATAEATASQLNHLTQLIDAVEHHQTSLEHLGTQPLPDISDLPAQVQQLSRLTKLADTAASAQAELETLQTLSWQLPDISKLQAVAGKHQRIKNLITAAKAADARRFTAGHEAFGTANVITELQHEYSHTLTEAGTCPTCQQSTKELAA